MDILTKGGEAEFVEREDVVQIIRYRLNKTVVVLYKNEMYNFFESSPLQYSCGEMARYIAEEYLGFKSYHRAKLLQLL